jgi:small-conductance mechanosensitive channel
MIKILTALFFGSALWIFLRALSFFQTLFVRSKSQHEFIQRVYPWVELVLWISFVYWLIDYFFSGLESIIYILIISLVSITLIAIAGWYVIRDIIAGASIKSDHALQVGEKVKTGNHAGVISALGILSLEITANDGEKHRIRYSTIHSETIAKVASNGNGKSHTIRLMIPMYYGAQNIEKALNRKLLEIPWVIAGGDITINLQAAGDFYETKISFCTMKEDMFNKTEEILKTYTDSVFNPEWTRQ